MKNFTTMITPYRKDGSVDTDTALRYVDWYFDSGIDGIFAVCQSSEIFRLSLQERVSLGSAVAGRVRELREKSGRPFAVISSGHVSDTLDGQAEELNAVWNGGTDALILITNRLDPENRGDDTFIENCRSLISSLPGDARLGLYECPYPYKRLVTPRILDFCASTGRFDYIKDTCCDAGLVRERCAILKGSGIQLMNANCQTLLDTVRGGCDGYCGIMCNYHPKLYAWLARNYLSDPVKADYVQGVIGTFGFTETGLPYPLTAKYHMCLCGIPTEISSRVRPDSDMTEYARFCVRQMKNTTDRMESMLGIG